MDQQRISADFLRYEVKIRGMTQAHRELMIYLEFKSSHIRNHLVRFYNISNPPFEHKESILQSDGAKPPLAPPHITEKMFQEFAIQGHVSVTGLTEEDVRQEANRDELAQAGASLFNGEIILDHQNVTLHLNNCPLLSLGDPGFDDPANVWCRTSELLYFNSVPYAGYNIRASFWSGNAQTGELGSDLQEVRFMMKYGNVKETTYLMGFKYAWVVSSVLIALWFYKRVSRLPAMRQSIEQTWIRVLVVTLILFNDPFYAIEIRLASTFLAVLGTIFQSTFFAVLLLFWLVLLDHIRLEAREQQIIKRRFYPAKVAFIFIFWLTTVLVTSYNLEQQRFNPGYSTRYDFGAYVLFKILSVGAILLYGLWIAAMSCVLFSEIRSLSRRFQVMLWGSMLVASLALIGLLLRQFSVIDQSMGEWTGFYSLFNIYVMLLAVLYAPSKQAIAEGDALRYGASIRGDANENRTASALHDADVSLELTQIEDGLEPEIEWMDTWKPSPVLGSHEDEDVTDTSLPSSPSRIVWSPSDVDDAFAMENAHEDDRL